jgi:PIN domain nuclease of toxin-antitoxin system
MAPLLLDTCAAIWFATAQRMSNAATDALNRSFAAKESVFLSPISAWEIGMLCARGRMRFTVSPHIWFERLQRMGGIVLADMPPSVLIASSSLPGALHGDPADRILAATAREYGYRLVTRDRPLLDYAGQGHIQALAG